MADWRWWMMGVVAAVVAQGAMGADDARARLPVVEARTEAVINGALKYLASRQRANGSWAESSGRSDTEVATTGYVLLSFLSTGNLPEAGPFAAQVRQGRDFLVGAVGPDGLLAGGGQRNYMYGHGVATIALAELYGQTRSAAVRAKLERLVRVIVEAQHSSGGWRYTPQPRDADISVTVLQLVGLRAAKNAGLDVPPPTLEAGVKYVRSLHDAATGGFTYQAGRKDPGFARTAAAIYSLQVCGQYDDPLVQVGSRYLFEHQRDQQWFTYGHFYAAPAQFMIGGATWARWYEFIRDLLLDNVQWDGDLAHWRVFLDNTTAYGPVFATAVYTTILAVPYQYLPLYQR